MSQASLADLPLEIQCAVLRNLPIATLLTFARTSRDSYVLVRTVLDTLHLAVFSKKVHGVLAFLNVANSIDYRGYNFLNEPELDWMNLPIKVPDHDIAPVTGRRARCFRRRGSNNVTTEHTPTIPTHPLAPLPSPQIYRERQIHHQNAHLSTVLSSSCLSNLTSLTIHTYALLNPSLSSALATNFPHLRHLSLNFSHPAIHDPCLPSFYWDSCPNLDKEGSTAWNLLAGIGSSSSNSSSSSSNQSKKSSNSSTPPLLHTLQTLSIKRAGLSSLQLRKWIERNPCLSHLRLSLVTGVDQAFVEGLAKLYLPTTTTQIQSSSNNKRGSVRHRNQLRSLVLESCSKLELRAREEFAWVEVLLGAGLRELSFAGCEGVDLRVLREVSEERGWTEGEERLVIVELEEGDAGDELETRSLTHESSSGGGVGNGLGVVKGRLGPVIEIDPQFD